MWFQVSHGTQAALLKIGKDLWSLSAGAAGSALPLMLWTTTFFGKTQTLVGLPGTGLIWFPSYLKDRNFVVLLLRNPVWGTSRASFRPSFFNLYRHFLVMSSARWLSQLC